MANDYCECGHQLPDCILTGRMLPGADISQTKPWLEWPTRIEDLMDHPDSKRLHHYMRCPDILSKLHYETRQRAIEVLRELRGSGSFVIMKGGSEEDWSYYQSDTLMCIFKQEQFFRYMFGVDIPDCMGVYDIDKEKIHLFVPSVPEGARQFLGDMETEAELKQRWRFDGCHPMAALPEFLSSLESRVENENKRVYILEGINNDSGLRTKTTADLSKYNLKTTEDRVKLYQILEESRVSKTPLEREMLRAACWISSMAHASVMKTTRVGFEELFNEAIFKSVCTIVGGARNVAYSCICAAKVNAAILHYGHAQKPNNAFIEDGDLLLHDMGGIFPSGYVADITVTYPANGSYSADQRIIYDAVLSANRAVKAAARPGVNWITMHELADFEVLKGLRQAGVIKKSVTDDKLRELVKERLGGYFMPHGLGHLIGLDTHDCGGHVPERKQELKGKPGLQSLRCTRDLVEGMYITVEPGCYFIRYLVNELKESGKFDEYIQFERLEDFMDMGGVRIEDDVMITESGCIDYTVVPRNIEDVEAFLKR